MDFFRYQILKDVLDACEHGVGGPVELEFAANLADGQRAPEFALLQVRPLSFARDTAELALRVADGSTMLCESDAVLGHGRIDDLRDIVIVDSARFGASRSQEIAAEIGRLNTELVSAGTPYLLIAVGRLGSSEPTLGVPVADQINGARSWKRAFTTSRSPVAGSHFFQHLMTFRVGYFTVNPKSAKAGDWPGSRRSRRSANAAACGTSG